ncbi:radical SAM protein [Methanimicrococcus blatticola]|uniref:radical SAM protein n=1 Tax=Methanimicrococcus blatticola TaxID=91560 RepID=UPI001CBFCC3B|nr:radical SAM protein [Methanimicrococcus blatticola]MCC2509277.1 radical SAM protein [Methanimicrococcus blatticola]
MKELDTIRPDESRSYSTFLTDGCLCCQKGAKMVLFVTGLCDRDCFFCPLSEERKNRDVIFANERAVLTDADVLEEARAMSAEGTGITGGEPLLELEKVIHYIRLLKEEFGENHHIHLYTSTAPSDEYLQVLAAAGLDEIRFHPPFELWDKLDDSDFDVSLKSA